MPVPKITTERLDLREFVPDDFDAYYDGIMSDADVMRYIPGGPATSRDTARESFDRLARGWEGKPYGILAVVERSSGDLIGHAGFKNLGAWRESRGSDDLEVLYALARRAWGKGLATELTRALIDWAFSVLRVGYLTAVTLPDNAPSQHVLVKAGFTARGIRRHYGLDCAFFDITAEPR